jgi:hypothetical protein
MGHTNRWPLRLPAMAIAHRPMRRFRLARGDWTAYNNKTSRLTLDTNLRTGKIRLFEFCLAGRRSEALDLVRSGTGWEKE